jgi:predicted phosphodiesterase
MSRVAVVADVHANYCALEAVLSHAGAEHVEAVFFLGDVVGYGPEPQRCLKLLQESADLEAWVTGNHDEDLGTLTEAIAGHDGDGEELLEELGGEIWATSDARAALRINLRLLDLYPDRREFLRARPAQAAVGERFFLVHGGLREGSPTTTYTRNRWDARDEFECLDARENGTSAKFLLVGHTHVPACFGQAEAGGEFQALTAASGSPVDLDGGRWLLNPGSVGQPRDGDWRASYMVLDEGRLTATVHRIEYDVRTTQARMELQRMPDNLITRLVAGR